MDFLGYKSLSFLLQATSVPAGLSWLVLQPACAFKLNSGNLVGLRASCCAASKPIIWFSDLQAGRSVEAKEEPVLCNRTLPECECEHIGTLSPWLTLLKQLLT